MGKVGDDGTPVPEINVQKPVPVVGVFPAKADDDEQIVWSVPALATVGIGSTLIVI